MQATLVRTEISNECVRGHLFLDDLVLATMEPPWRANARNVSCIPAGDYRAAFLLRSASGKYRQVYHLHSVPERGDILIHNGNVAAHTQGCILVGTRFGALAGKRAVLNSRLAMRLLREKTNCEPLELQIVGDQHVGMG